MPRINHTPGVSRHPNRIQLGFSLIELLVVLVILSLLGGIVGPRLLKHLGQAKSNTAALQIEDLSAALDVYMLETGQYPTTDQGLTALVEAPTDSHAWNGPYLRKNKVPDDPWGVQYHYKSPGEHGDFDLFTYGADTAPGGDKDARDVNNWE
jgi:general secretion pathway protein G